VPRTIWSALRGSTPRRIATSTVASSLTLDVSPGQAGRLPAASRASCGRPVSAAFRYDLLRFHSFLLLGQCGAGQAGVGPSHVFLIRTVRSWRTWLNDKLDRRLPAEDRHQHLEPLAVPVDLADGRRQRGETGRPSRSTASPTSKVDLDGRLGSWSTWPPPCHRPGPWPARPGAAGNFSHVVQGQRGRLGRRADEPGHPGGVAHRAPGPVV